MKKRRFLISSLIAAGIAPAPAFPAAPSGPAAFGGGPGPDDEDALIRRFAQTHGFTLAQHRSHSSHASHSSHRSGTSGTIRSPSPAPAPRAPRVTPTPSPTPSRNQRSTPPSSILPSSPATAPQSLFSPPTPSRSQVENIVRQVQLGLIAYGYYEGSADGIVGPKTRDALRRFQTDFGLKVTGTITPEVLDAFKIVAQ
jgi:His-Xaa-Ser repeat protein HxsA